MLNQIKCFLRHKAHQLIRNTIRGGFVLKKRGRSKNRFKGSKTGSYLSNTDYKFNI